MAWCVCVAQHTGDDLGCEAVGTNAKVKGKGKLPRLGSPDWAAFQEHVRAERQHLEQQEKRRRGDYTGPNAR